ncbi:unnamed protein product, partial [Discosporangium mesarthrocarpum]
PIPFPQGQLKTIRTTSTFHPRKSDHLTVKNNMLMNLVGRQTLRQPLRCFGSSAIPRGNTDWLQLLSLRQCLTDFDSPLLWSHSEDDVAGEFAALDWLQRNSPRSGQGMRVLQACGGGDTAVALLGRDDVASVHCVDACPAQLHLAQLKLTLALSDMPQDEVLAFLGMNRPGWDRGMVASPPGGGSR